jgi:hypothetical protein
MEERSGPSEPGVVRAAPFGERRRRSERAVPPRPGDGGTGSARHPGIDELFADLAALDTSPPVPAGRRTGGGRRRRGPGAAASAEHAAARAGHPSGSLFGDAADLVGDDGPGRGAAFGAPGAASGPVRRRGDAPVADDERIDPEERAFLLQVYRELVGGVQGPVIPFPVELVAGEDEAPELDRPADVIDLDWHRTRRALRDA